MRQPKPDNDPIIAEKIRQALEAPVEEREKLVIPQPAPVETLQRWSLKPVAPRSRKKS